MVLFADLLRYAVLVLFGLTVGETGFILKKYGRIAKATRRLLPIHITGVTVGLLMLETYVAIKTIGYIGDPFSWLTPYNIVALSLIYASLVAVRKHVTPKAQLSKDMESLLEDPDFIP
jgi:hypothetical protein